MLYKALKSFSGPKISMAKGQEKDIQEPELIQDLLRAGYIMEKKVKDEIKKIDEEIKEVKKNENKKDNKKDTKKDNKKNTKK